MLKISVPYTDRQSYRFSHESKRGGQTGMHLVVLLYKMRTVSLFILDQPVQSSQQNIYKGQNVLIRRKKTSFNISLFIHVYIFSTMVRNAHCSHSQTISTLYMIKKGIFYEIPRNWNTHKKKLILPLKFLYQLLL